MAAQIKNDGKYVFRRVDFISLKTCCVFCFAFLTKQVDKTSQAAIRTKLFLSQVGEPHCCSTKKKKSG